MNNLTTEFIQSVDSIVSIDEIVNYALQQEFVLGARAFEYDETVVLAILATPFYLKSERDKAKLTMTESLQNRMDNKKLVLTFDMQVYRNIQDEIDEQAKAQLLELAKMH